MLAEVIFTAQLQPLLAIGFSLLVTESSLCACVSVVVSVSAACARASVRAYVRACLRTCVCAYVCACVSVCVSSCMRACVCVSIFKLNGNLFGWKPRGAAGGYIF